MVGMALTIEREIKDARGIRAASTSEKREDQPFSSSRKRHKTYVARVFQGRGCGQQGQGQTRASSQAGQVTCFHYQQPGHMRQDCPQRQGSQGFRTVQS